MEELSVIVPAYNEAQILTDSINKLISALNKCELKYEIVIVNDGSTDETPSIAEALSSKYSFIKVVHHKKNKMIGAAIVSGILASSYENIILSPVDSPLKEEQIKLYIEKSKFADIVCGYRTKKEGYSFLMRIFSFIYKKWLDLMFGLNLKDYTWICLYKRKIFEKIKPIFNGISFFPEILVKVYLNGYKIEEVESPMQARKVGKATVAKPSRIINLFFETIKLGFHIYFNYRKDIVFLFIICLLGFVLRVSIINFGLPSKNLALTTYNPDEAITFYSIEKWQPKKFYFHPTDGFFWGGFHLYPSALSLGVAKILGYVKFGNREFYINNLKEADKLYITVRLLMILCATLSIFIIFLILKSAYSDASALLGAFLLSILPMHVFNSIYVRPDIMMMFFGLLAIYFSLRILETNKTKYYILSCLAVGFSAGTKINGAVFGVLPIVAHFLSEKKNKKIYQLFLIPIICLAGLILSSPYILLDFNRTQYSFLRYLKNISGFTIGAGDIGQIVLLGYGPLSYIKHYLKYGCGTVVVVFTILGVVLMLVNVFKNKNKNKYDILFLISGLIVFFVVSFITKNQVVWYTMPVIPFVLIFISRGMEIIYKARDKLSKTIFVLLTIFLFCYTLIYTFSYWRLYREKNVREEASKWIEKNIPKVAKVAIARSYFWTPPVLRQYNPPYKVLMGADPVKSSVQEGVLGLKNLLDETEYVVLTEYEFRWALHPKLQKYFPEHKKILDEIFYLGKFIKLAEFDKEAKFLFLKFKKNYPPGDWLIPNPKIIIFKKV